ncbi:lysozyme family protein [Risungbinella massiliensis]|uniref:lysozyme family protein n=1 Tax=Risungbinella massiliensis TaxID=1329796 RepID=UPI00069C93F5|nr:lysozyme family protein [Risungbinella massiliensis]
MASKSSGIGRKVILPFGFAFAGPLFFIGIVIIIGLFIIITSGNQIGTSTNISATAATRSISPQVLRFQGEIEKAMQQQQLPANLLPYILALTMQESGGNHVDIMQSSESMCNGRIGCIQDPATSIRYGIRHFKSVWDQTNSKAKSATNPAAKDPENILKITLQSYNFGPGFVGYAFQNGGVFSENLARAFSLKHATRSSCGWRSPYCYGDYKYVEHVYRYLTINDPVITNISNSNLVGNNSAPITKWTAESQIVVDPTSPRGRVTRRTADMYREVISKKLFTTEGYRSASCYSPRTWGEHPKGRACDFVYQFNRPATGMDLSDGTKLANYLVLNQQRLGVKYVIWSGKIWQASEPEKGWQTYRSSFYGCPIEPSKMNSLLKSKAANSLWTGCHYDHVHVSMY